MIPRAGTLTCADDPVTSGAGAAMTSDNYASMMPDGEVLSIPDDAARASGWHIGALLEFVIPVFSYSETLNGSLSVWAKSTCVT